jgi:hypothetical protein
MWPGRGPKTAFSLNLGGLPLEKCKKTLLTMKMVDSGLENKHFSNLSKKLD